MILFEGVLQLWNKKLNVKKKKETAYPCNLFVKLLGSVWKERERERTREMDGAVNEKEGIRRL